VKEFMMLLIKKSENKTSEQENRIFEELKDCVRDIWPEWVLPCVDECESSDTFLPDEKVVDTILTEVPEAIESLLPKKLEDERDNEILERFMSHMRYMWKNVSEGVEVNKVDDCKKIDMLTDEILKELRVLYVKQQKTAPETAPELGEFVDRIINACIMYPVGFTLGIK
jgi:hypothetical protein